MKSPGPASTTYSSLVAPAEPGAASNNVKHRFELAMMVRSCTSRGLNANGSSPQLAGPGARVCDGGGARHPGRLRRIAIQLSSADNADSVLFPIGHTTLS